jgi:hypothetical protein
MTTTKDTPAVSFSDWLAGYGAGNLNDKLTAAVRDVAEDVMLLDKSGTITLKLTFAPKGGGLIVSPKVTVAPPEGKEAGQFFFVAADGSLSRRDPNQPQLPTMEDKS